MRTTVVIASALILILPGAMAVARSPSLDARSALRAVDREIGQRNDDVQRLEGDEARARASIAACTTLREELARREAHLTDLDARITAAEQAVGRVEEMMGYNDPGWGGVPAFFNKWVVPTLFGGDFGPHASEYRSALTALEAARVARGNAVAEIDRDLAAQGGAVPQTLAALRRAVDAGEFQEQEARSRLRSAADQLAAVRLALERLATQKVELERRQREPAVIESTEPVPSVAPPSEPPRISGRVVDQTGLGRPENYADIERCTWKFFVQLTQETGDPVLPYSGRIVTVLREPADIQKQTPAGIGPAVTYGVDRALRAGPFYLTVQRADGYQGSFTGTFEFEGALGAKASCTVTWSSPGRPPVGPPNPRPSPSAAVPTPRALTLVGGLDRKALDRKLHHLLVELGFPEASYTAGPVTLQIVPPAAAGQPWQGRITPAQIQHHRHLKHTPTRERKPVLEEWWDVTITLSPSEGRKDAQTGRASVVHEYRSSWGAKARHEYPDERWHAVLQADGSYRLHVPGIEDGIPYRLEVLADR